MSATVYPGAHSLRTNIVTRGCQIEVFSLKCRALALGAGNIRPARLSEHLACEVLKLQRFCGYQLRGRVYNETCHGCSPDEQMPKRHDQAERADGKMEDLLARSETRCRFHPRSRHR